MPVFCPGVNAAGEAVSEGGYAQLEPDQAKGEVWFVICSEHGLFTPLEDILSGKSTHCPAQKKKNINPGQRPCLLYYGRARQYIDYKTSPWACRSCAEEKKEYHLNKADEEGSLVPADCLSCRKPRGTGLDNNSLEHVICTRKIFKREVGNFKTCGYVNKVDNKECVNVDCKSKLLGNPELWVLPGSLDLVEIFWCLKGDPDGKSAWFCTLCRGETRHQQESCEYPDCNGKRTEDGIRILHIPQPWACRACLANKREIQLNEGKADKCKCGEPRGSGPDNNSLEYMLCRQRPKKTGLRCGFYNQVGNETCLNPKCGSELPAYHKELVLQMQPNRYVFLSNKPPSNFGRWCCTVPDCFSLNTATATGCAGKNRTCEGTRDANAVRVTY